MATAIGIGAGTAIALAITIVTFAHWEAIRMISERYKRLQFNEGMEKGRKETLEAERKRVTKVLEDIGEKLTPEERERLLGTWEEKRS